jgi:predicted nucleic acid-binding protein
VPRSRALIDTSVILDLERVKAQALPDEMAIAAISLAELAAGTHAARDPLERARRLERLQRAEASFPVLPFDVNAARAYGSVYAAIESSGRKARGRRAVDLMIAATALAWELPLFTRNPRDFVGLSALLEVVPIPLASPD